MPSKTILQESNQTAVTKIVQNSENELHIPLTPSAIHAIAGNEKNKFDFAQTVSSLNIFSKKGKGKISDTEKPNEAKTFEEADLEKMSEPAETLNERVRRCIQQWQISKAKGDDSKLLFHYSPWYDIEKLIRRAEMPRNKVI